MKNKIKKALDSAVNNLLINNNWLTIALKRSDVKIIAYFNKEHDVDAAIGNAQAEVAKARKHSWVKLSSLDMLYSSYVESGDFTLGFDYWVNGWLDYTWLFIGDRKNGIKRICRVDFAYNSATIEVCDLPLQPMYESDDIYQFANDVLQAFTIEPHLFEVFYDFQVEFFGNGEDILYNVEYLAEYERIDV